MIKYVPKYKNIINAKYFIHLFFIQLTVNIFFTLGTYGCLYHDAYIRLYTENRYSPIKSFTQNKLASLY